MILGSGVYTIAEAMSPTLKRLGRIFLGVIAAASMVICVAAAGLWWRGYSTADTVMWRTGRVVAGDDWQRVEYMTRSHRGRIVVWRTGRVMTEQELGADAPAAHAVLLAEPALHYWMNDSSVFRAAWPEPAAGALGWFGLRWRPPAGGTSAQLGVPRWMGVAATGILPAWLAIRFLRDRRSRENALAEVPS